MYGMSDHRRGQQHPSHADSSQPKPRTGIRPSALQVARPACPVHCLSKGARGALLLEDSKCHLAQAEAHGTGKQTHGTRYSTHLYRL